jgi:hypothetical protein
MSEYWDEKSHELAKALNNECNRHTDMTEVEKAWAAMMLVGDIISSCVIDVGMEEAAKRPQRPHVEFKGIFISGRGDA